MLELLAVMLVLYFFWRPLLAVALVGAAVVVPLLVGLAVYVYTASTLGAVVAAAFAAFYVCSLIGDAADKFGS